jgi:DNA-binding response OmpR family regulator
MAIDSAAHSGGSRDQIAAKRILIVEDEVMIALHIAQILRAEGHVVVGPCVRHSQAEEAVNGEQIDGALLDFNLGNGKNTADIARVLQDRGVPYAFLTASSSDEITSCGVSADIIAKPLTSDSVLQVVARW